MTLKMKPHILQPGSQGLQGVAQPTSVRPWKPRGSCSLRACRLRLLPHLTRSLLRRVSSTTLPKTLPHPLSSLRALSGFLCRTHHNASSVWVLTKTLIKCPSLLGKFSRHGKPGCLCSILFLSLAHSGLHVNTCS